MHFGGDVAAPVFREIADKLYAVSVNEQKPFLARWVKTVPAITYAAVMVKT